MAKLDDFLQKKKETAPILDLSKATCSSNEEFRRLLEKVPDFKIKPEKVSTENIKIRDKAFTFKSGKKDLKNMREPYLFMNPLPVEMQELKIDDLAGVSIDWRMLTTKRPKSRVEENYFSRLVELGKLQNKSRAAEKRQLQLDPQTRKSKNKAGVVEMRVVSCIECGEDFCNGKVCGKFGYDSFARQTEAPKTSQKILSPESGEKTKKKIKRKSRSKSKTKRTGRGKSKSKSPKKKSPSKPPKGK
ncbi:uncharacterized protein LOC126739596 [Anthonomus grandis grandis]|uniref:uncharacterized protein LOC126739596 n=1 Tax=Anthonomus grandis grandis TaxID=2921223 RepID=UPI00216599AC|nr:uncharacterized protein LOC126739596 [Anthonomus grandis grandis]